MYTETLCVSSGCDVDRRFNLYVRIKKHDSCAMTIEQLALRCDKLIWYRHVALYVIVPLSRSGGNVDLLLERIHFRQSEIQIGNHRT